MRQVDFKEIDLEHLWHSFTQMEEYRKMGGKIIVEGKGTKVTDIEGKEYIDGMGGLSTCAIGHGREEIIEAIQDQIRKIEFVPLFDFFSNVPAIQLARKLAQITPGDLQYVQFGCSGSDAVEIALKIARQYQRRLGFATRYKVIARKDSFHGVSMGALSANGITELRESFEPLLPGFTHIPPCNCYHCHFGKEYPHCNIECAEALEKQILFEGSQSVAAFITEPIPAHPRGGVTEPPKEYFPRIREICDKYEALFIADEIFTGFGKTGKMFACEHYNVIPDIMTIGKGLSSGYFPISATIVKPKVYEAFLGPTHKQAFMHGQTYQGHPLGCAVALKNTEIIEREKLVENAEIVGKYLRKKLEGTSKYSRVASIRGKGLLQSIELIDNVTGKEISYEEGMKLKEKAYRLGLICKFQASSLMLYPSLTLTKKEVEKMAEIINQVLSD